MTGLIVPVTAAPLLDPGQARITLELPHGLTVADIILRAFPGISLADARLRVTLVSDQGCAVIPPALWTRVRPNAGVQVVIRSIPGGDDALRSVLLVVVAAAALAFAPVLAPTLGTFGQSLVAAGLTIAGTLLVNALIPIPTSFGDTRRDTYQINGWRNQPRPGEPVPLVLGRHRMAPPFAARSWTEVVGNDQYVRALFCVGYGPVRISDVRIGETSVDDFDDIDVEIREGRPGDALSELFSQQVIEEPSGVELVRPYPTDENGEPIEWTPTDGLVSTIETPVVRWTASDVSEIGVILSFPTGLFRVDDEGNIRTRIVAVRIRARLDGLGDWTTIERLKISAKKRENFLRRYTWQVPTRGRWQVEVTRMTRQALDPQISDRVVLAAIQSIRPEYPINFDKPLALIAMRVRATFQLNGSLDSVNATVEREGPVRDGDAWVPGYGRTPATAFLVALTGPSNPYPVSETEIDMDLIADWHDWCLAKGLKYDRVHERSESLGEMLALICAAGRATPRHDGVRWGVVIDWPEELVIDHINPRNSAEFSWSRNYFAPPDGLRVRFLDATNDFQEAERVVPWPGHTGPVQLTEALDLPGKTDPDEIWIEARRRMYELIHRPDQFSVLQDGASRVATRGDLVMGSFDVLENTQVAARVKSVVGNLVALDEEVIVSEGYGLRLRVYADDADVIGTSLVRAIAAAPEPTGLVRFLDAGAMPEVGDVVHIGPLTSESIALRVRGIEPGEDFVSRLLLVAAAPQIDALVDAEVPPVWDGRVGAEAGASLLVPTAPQFQLISVGTVEGGGVSTVEVLLRAGAGSSALVTGFEIDHRLAGATPWTTISVTAADGGSTIADYTTDDDIELRARALTATLAGPYTAIIDLDISTGISTAPPAVPSGAVILTDLVASAEVAITADANPDVDAFQIYRVPTGALVDRAVHAIGPLLASTPSTTVTYVDVVAPGSYDYYVDARNVAGKTGPLAGPFTLTVTAPPP